MRQAEVRLVEPIAEISPLVFGGLVEHFGRTTYGGIWDDERDIPRADVQACVRALGTTLLRYPGGCFSSWYRWRDGVGPKDRRPRYERQYWTDRAENVARSMARLGTLDEAFGGHDPEEVGRRAGPPEPNLFGTDEFLQYCVDVDAEPFLIANLGGGEPEGSGTPDEAADWVRYCNVDRKSPRPVRWWGVGNETWGAEELGHCPPADYGARFAEFARAMRAVDPTIELVAVGSPLRAFARTSEPSPQREGWNHHVLRAAGGEVDALSVHWYFPVAGRRIRDDEADTLQIVTGSDGLADGLDATIRVVDDVVGAQRKLPIALDEWNIWSSLDELVAPTNHRLCDAVFVAGCYNRMLERADRVRIGVVSHLVNCLAPIQTAGDRHFVTSEYLVGMLYRWLSRRSAVRVQVESDVLYVPPMADVGATLLATPSAQVQRVSAAVDAAATADDRGVTVFLANRCLDHDVRVDVSALPGGADGRFRYVVGEGPFARNAVDAPHALRFRDVQLVVGEDGRCSVVVPPHTAGALVVSGRTA